jgi:hypothetical protein
LSVYASIHKLIRIDIYFVLRVQAGTRMLPE